MHTGMACVIVNKVVDHTVLIRTIKGARILESDCLAVCTSFQSR